MKSQCHTILSALFSAALLAGCDLGVDSPYNSYPRLGTSSARDVRLELIDYDRVKVTHTSGKTLVGENLAAVGIGVKDTSGYRELAYRAAGYDPRFDVRRIDFEFIVRVDVSEIYAPLTIRYYFVDSTYKDVDTSVATYKFPYASTELVVTKAILGPAEQHFEDIDVAGDRLYYRVMGRSSFYEYNLATGQKRLLFIDAGGNNLAVDSVFMFWDYSRSVYRFNLQTDTIDLVFPPSTSNPFGIIFGLDTYDGRVYALRYLSIGYGENNLLVYAYDGTLLDSLAVNPIGYYMTIDGGIMYSGESIAPGYIRRYDLKTRTHLPALLAPSRDFTGIKISQGKLYFCDHARAFVGCVPMSELRTTTIDIP